MFVDRLLPEKLRPESVDTRRRAHLCVYAILTANIACLLVICMMLVLERYPAALAVSYSLIWQTLVLGLLYFTRSASVAGHFLTVLIFAETLPHVAAGTEYAIFAVMAVPILATNLISLRSGVVWTLIAVIWAGVINPLWITADPVIQGMNYAVAIMSLVVGVASFIVEHARAMAVIAAEAMRLKAQVQYERIRAFAEGAFPAIIETRQGVIAYASAGTEPLLGYEEGAMVGAKLTSFVHPGDFASHQRTFAAELNGFRLELRMRHQNGQWVWVQVFAISYGPQAENRWVFAARDNADDRKARDRLLQVQKLEGVGVLAAGIAHDFNNLLTVILGFGELLPESLEKQEILKASSDAANLTSQLMAFGQKSPVSASAIDAIAAIRELQPLFKSLLTPRIRLEYLFDEQAIGLPVNASQFNQVVLNLVKNAKEAIVDSGRIEISLCQSSLDREEASQYGLLPGDYLKLCVRDDGVGMSQKAADRAFDPFYTTKQPGKGSGLGLASTYGVVTQFGGGVRLQSKIGEGTLVTVYLPIAEMSLDHAYAATNLDGQMVGKGITVLLVDDEDRVRKVIREVLIRAGFQVTTAVSGNEALAIFESVNPSLLITDIVMAGMRGTELVEKLRLSNNELPALLISGYAGEELDLWLQPDERTRFLAKPFRSEELLHQVNALVSRRVVAPDTAHS